MASCCWVHVLEVLVFANGHLRVHARPSQLETTRSRSLPAANRPGVPAGHRISGFFYCPLAGIVFPSGSFSAPLPFCFCYRLGSHARPPCGCRRARSPGGATGRTGPARAAPGRQSSLFGDYPTLAAVLAFRSVSPLHDPEQNRGRVSRVAGQAGALSAGAPTYPDPGPITAPKPASQSQRHAGHSVR